MRLEQGKREDAAPWQFVYMGLGLGGGGLGFKGLGFGIQGFGFGFLG